LITALLCLDLQLVFKKDLQLLQGLHPDLLQDRTSVNLKLALELIKKEDSFELRHNFQDPLLKEVDVIQSLVFNVTRLFSTQFFLQIHHHPKIHSFQICFRPQMVFEPPMLQPFLKLEDCKNDLFVWLYSKLFHPVICQLLLKILYWEVRILLVLNDCKDYKIPKSVYCQAHQDS